MHDNGMLYKYLVDARLMDAYGRIGGGGYVDARTLYGTVHWLAGRLRSAGERLEAWANRPASPAVLERLIEERGAKLST